MYKIIISKKTYKFISSQNKEQQARILNAINGLPNIGNIKPMKGFDGVYRLRIGNYRALYNVNHEEKTIYVNKIDNRGQIYK